MLEQLDTHSVEAYQSTSATMLLSDSSAAVSNNVTVDRPPLQETSIYDPDHLDRIWSQLMSDGSKARFQLQDLYSPRKSIAELCLALPSNVQIQR